MLTARTREHSFMNFAFSIVLLFILLDCVTNEKQPCTKGCHVPLTAFYRPVKALCKCKFNVKLRECLHNHPSQRLIIKCLTIPDLIGIWKCWFLRRGENQSTWRKTSRSKEENQQQIQPTYDAASGNRTRDTLVGGERSHHCAIPALPKSLN